LTDPDHKRALLGQVFAAGIAAVRAADYLPPHLPPAPPKGRLCVIALGKAAGDMAAVAARHRPIDRGLVILPAGAMPRDAVLPPSLEVIVAGHPIPNAESQRAGEAALALASGLMQEDMLLLLVSGGGSALLAAPLPPLSLADKMAITDQLLRAGAPITDINRVRRHLSRVKGGRLAAAAAPATVHNLILSDVPGDDLAMVASGPGIAAAPDPEWRAIAARWGVPIPADLADPPITVAPGPPPLCVGNADLALSAMAATAARAGYAVVNLGGALEGDALALAHHHAALARKHAEAGRPVAMISGGESSVAVTGTGRGGRNQSYAAALAVALAGAPAVAAIAGDSDGIDGNSAAAGAMIFPDSIDRLARHGEEFAALLAANDTARGFALLGDAVITGPTLTNVNDLRCLLIH
jgi:hydroxypyruvate reductase